MPFIDEYTYMKDADVYDSIIKLVTCQDEQGQKRPCTIEEIQKECTALPNCAAFNSNGYLKSFIRKGEKTGKTWEFHWLVEGTDLYIRKTKYVGNECKKP